MNTQERGCVAGQPQQPWWLDPIQFRHAIEANHAAHMREPIAAREQLRDALRAFGITRSAAVSQTSRSNSKPTPDAPHTAALQRPREPHIGRAHRLGIGGHRSVRSATL